MNAKTFASLAPACVILLVAILACTFGQVAPAAQSDTGPQQLQQSAPLVTPLVIEEDVAASSPTSTPPVAHVMKPAAVALTGSLVYDVESVGTAPEQRAPYGDSYNINRLERPFLQNMSYNSNLDLSTFTLGHDNDWYYLNIALVGNDPNDKLAIHYGAELDLDHDGFGDYIIWAHPPYPVDWDTAPVQIYQDTNHDTGGLSAEQSDAPLIGNGYDALIFNGGTADADPDMAWIRVNHDAQGSVQFAFKRSWSGNVFMLGVLADAGLADPGKLDYVDRMTIEEAGSPIRANIEYPLKGLFAVDNICRAAFGFKPTGYEPQLCPMAEPVQRTPRPHVTPVSCVPPPDNCAGGWWVGEPYCQCDYLY